ncbi:MAG: hypothetical protein JSV09_15890, partial [Thermoplasmata archaeon]
MSVFKKNLGKSRKRMIFTITVLFWMVFLALGLAIPVAGQETDISIAVDQGYQIADFTVYKDITISLTGNYSISTDSIQPVTVYFGIHAPEGWVTSISPESVTVTLGTDAFDEFEGEITPNSASEQKTYDIYVWASAESRNYGDIDWSSSPTSSERITFPIELILNRVKVITSSLERLVLPEETITHTFTVTNVATVPDTFFINLIGDEALKEKGWTVAQSDSELILGPQETDTFYVEQQIPKDAQVGDYKVEVVVSSSGDIGSKSSQTLLTKVRVPKISEPFWTLGLVLMVAFIGTSIGLAAFFAATEYGYLA